MLFDAIVFFSPMSFWGEPHYTAYDPRYPGCKAVGWTYAELMANLEKAREIHGVPAMRAEDV